jgi:DNA-binding GntR family transcriptional regulator
MSTFRAKKSVPLREQAYNLILASMKKGIYKPGERLTETKAANDLGVSRTPVREALAQLGENGLLTPRGGGGYIIASPPSLEELNNIFELRMLIEPYAVARAAREYTDAEYEQLEKLIQKEIAHVNDTNPDAFADANEKFRSLMLGKVNSPILRQCISLFENNLQLMRIVTLRDLTVRQTIVLKQQAILDAMRSGNAAKANNETRQYIKYAKKCLTNALKKYTDKRNSEYSA